MRSWVLEESRVGNRWYWILKPDIKFGGLNNLEVARSHLRQG